MKLSIPLLICLAYILGLFSTGSLSLLPLVLAWGIFGAITAIIIPRFWRTGPRLQQWLLATTIALVAVSYFHWRLPYPSENDISQQLIPVPGKSTSEFLQIQGKILTNPRLTRSNNFQFWLEATQANRQSVTGKIYVTATPELANNLSANQQVTISGILYEPQKSPNPGGFDFRAYLARQGSFSALKALKIKAQPLEVTFWDISLVAERIIVAQVQGLGDRLGRLVASMVLGNQRVDLPYDLKDQFIQAGLAHVLAASGFQVSFLLGVVLCLTRRLSLPLQFIIGLATIIIYIGLTGVQPSVMRAAVMGIAALIALVTHRKVKPLGSLVLAATMLLLINPIWIWDFGFQLSFLATLGLIVTLPALLKYLDWLPDIMATMIAIPIAASIWTLPLLIYVFSNVVLYSIPSNVIAAPLIAFISLGGMISACVGLLWQEGGSGMAWLLTLPTQWLIKIVEFVTSLPGSSLAVGQIPLAVLLLIYTAFILVCLSKWWQNRWWLVGLFSLALVILPQVYQKTVLAQQIKVTVLAAKQAQVIVIQDHGKVGLINTGDADTVRYTILPFFNLQGINSLDCLVNLGADSKQNRVWVSDNCQSIVPKQLLSGVSLTPLLPEKPLSLPETKIRSISADPPILELEIKQNSWLLLGDVKQIPFVYQLITTDFTPSALMWSGRSLKKQWLELIKPKIAIVSSSSVHAKTRERLEKEGIELYWTGRDGAMEWTPENGWQTIIDITKDIML